jgi:dipeptidyl aminopeptidase/acylaminoacyl peptidase
MRPSSLLLSLALAASPLGAQERLTFDHLRRSVGVGGTEITPDGKTIVVSVTRPNYERNKNESELYAVDVATGATRQLTFDRRSVSGARFAPDGKMLAFESPDANGKMQVWVLPLAGGEARRVTNHPTGVEHFSWRPDGNAMVYAAEDEAPKREGEEKFLTTFKVGAQDLFLREAVQPRHIWLATLDGVAPKRLTSGTWTLEFALPPGSPPSGLSWSPDGRTIAFVEAVAPESGKLDSVHVQLLDVASGKITPLTSMRRFENSPLFSPDGRTMAYMQPRDGRGDLGWENEAWVVPAGGGAGRSVTKALDRNLYSLQWMPDGKSLLVAANDRAAVGAWVQPLDGAARKLDVGDLVINGAYSYDITVANDVPVIAFTATRATQPTELYVMDSPMSAPRQLTHFNDWARNVALGKSELVSWKSDAFEANGIVTYPPNFDPARKYPLVLVIHGGPTSASKLNFSVLPQLMATEGWIVFQPNYRGSDNIGQTFQVAIVGDAGAGPGRDVMAGVAMLRKRPYVDATRTAVTGWSYGGYMTSWLIGNYPTEWTAAMAGAPVTNWEDMYNWGDGSINIRYTFGGSPWTDGRMKAYRDQSPITYATRVKAPTLVMSNMEDFRVPPTQAFALYRAMKDNGVETEFIAFTGRTHSSADPVNSRERNRLWIDWVKRHIDGGRATP